MVASLRARRSVLIAGVSFIGLGVVYFIVLQVVNISGVAYGSDVDSPAWILNVWLLLNAIGVAALLAWCVLALLARRDRQ